MLKWEVKALVTKKIFLMNPNVVELNGAKILRKIKNISAQPLQSEL
jgi:hypothetical protein